MYPSTNSHHPDVPLPPHDRRCLRFRLDADPFWLSPLRSLVSGLGLRARLGVEAATDLMTAADEAVAVLMTVAATDEQITGHLEVTTAGVRAAFTLRRTYLLPPEALGWRILRALVDRVELVTDPTGIVLLKKRTLGTS